jgi:tetratricopeptide (TPR) repeat protein
VPFISTLLLVLALIANAIRLRAFIDLKQNSSFKILTNLCYSVLMTSKTLYIILFLAFAAIGLSQDSTDLIQFQQIQQVQNVQSNSAIFKKAVGSNDLLQQANAYYELAGEYYDDNNFAQSEEYYFKSKELYLKLGKRKKAGKASRKLAKTQEQQEKFKDAISSYQFASENNPDSLDTNLNNLDYSRLLNRNSLEEEGAIQQKIISQKASNNSIEEAESYSQLAEYKLRKNNVEEALDNFQNAYELSKEEEPFEALQYNQKINDILIKENKIDEAIALKSKVLNEDFVQKNSRIKVKESLLLAGLLVRKKKNQEAILLLKESYHLSTTKGHTFEAQNSLKQLDSLYTQLGRHTEILPLYKNFIKQLPLVIEKDNSLLNKKILDETIQIISQLEEEKKLRDEIIQRKNIFNYSLIISVVVLMILLTLIFLAQRKLKINNKKIALQSLRREMNPHFIFNSLNSINQYITLNDELEANQFLTQYSKLMRTVMENSSDDFISFSKETEFLKNYLILEKKRFTDAFDYTLKIDESIEHSSNLFIPGMLVQPFIENAIWHGLRYSKDKGKLQIRFSKIGESLRIEIEDDGIGIKKSKEHKTMHQKQNKSRGIKNTLERIDLLNYVYKKNISCTIQDKELPETGVLVTIDFIPGGIRFTDHH